MLGLGGSPKFTGVGRHRVGVRREGRDEEEDAVMISSYVWFTIVWIWSLNPPPPKKKKSETLKWEVQGYALGHLSPGLLKKDLECPAPSPTCCPPKGMFGLGSGVGECRGGNGGVG